MSLAAKGSQGGEIQPRGRIGLAVPGHDMQRGLVCRWCDRNPCVSGRGDGGRNTGDNFKGIPCCRSSSSSSPPRPKRNGSPPFRRTTRRAPLRLFEQEAVDILLRQGVRTGLLACVDDLGLRRDPASYAVPDQMVAKHCLRLFQNRFSFHGQQARSPGPAPTSQTFPFIRFPPASAGLIVRPAARPAPAPPSRSQSGTIRFLLASIIRAGAALGRKFLHRRRLAKNIPHAEPGQMPALPGRCMRF